MIRLASIQRRGNRSFLLVVEAGTGPRGREKKTKTIRIDDDALLKTTRKLDQYLQAELAKFQMEVDAGTYIKAEKMLFSAFVEEWKKKFVTKNLEYKTVENYLLHVKNRIGPYFNAMPMERIKTMHIVDYLDKLSEQGIGSATLVYNYRVLRSIFHWAKEWKVIATNPMDGVKKPKETPSVSLNVYDEEEAAELFRALQSEDQQFRVLVSLALTTGLRRGELLGLEWKNIDLDEGIIHVVQSIPAFKDGQPIIKLPKNINSVRQVAVAPSVLQELRRYRKEWILGKQVHTERWIAEGEFLFCNASGLPFYPKTIGDKWRSFHNRNPQLKYIRFHDLRHTSATLLINQGVHAKIISERLGHSNIGTTMNVYGHVIRKADQKAAALFDDILAK